jgi:hypothetical protein
VGGVLTGFGDGSLTEVVGSGSWKDVSGRALIGGKTTVCGGDFGLLNVVQCAAMAASSVGAGGAWRHDAPFGLVGQHRGGSVVAGHGEQSGDQQWRMEQSSDASEFEQMSEMALLFVEVVIE